MVTEVVEIVVRERGARATSRNIRRVGTSSTTAASAVRALTVALAAVGVGFGLSQVVSTLREFEERMAGVRAITQATDAQFASLSRTARQLGATTVFTASESAQGLRLFAQAGFTVAESQAAIRGALDLAVAGQLDLASAVNISSNAVRGFGLDASESSRVADVLAAAATNANTTVFELGDALKFVAPVASAANLSIEETAAAIGVLSDAGLKGTLAGTGLRRILAGLLNPSNEAEEVFSRFGISLSEINPRFNSLREIIERLTPVLEDPANAFTLFQQRGGPAAIALSRLSDRLDTLGEATENAGGRAREVSDVLLNTLGGSFRLLRSALEEAVLQFGESGFGGALRDTIDIITAVVNTLTGMQNELAQTSPVVQTLVQRIRALEPIADGAREAIDALLDAVGQAQAEASTLNTIALAFSALLSAVGTGIRAIVAGANAIGFALRSVSQALGLRTIEEVDAQAVKLQRSLDALKDSAFNTEDAFRQLFAGLEQAPPAVDLPVAAAPEEQEGGAAPDAAGLDLAGLEAPEAATITSEQEKALSRIEALTNRLRIARQEQIEPLNAELERLQQQREQLEEQARLVGDQADIAEGLRLISAQEADIRQRQTDATQQQADLLLDLNDTFTQLSTISPQFAADLQAAANAAVEAGGGVETVNRNLQELLDEGTRELERTAKDAERVGQDIADELTGALTSTLRSALEGEAVNFGQTLADTAANFLNDALNDVLNDLAQALQSLLSEQGQQGGGGGGGLGSTIAGVVGVVGGIVAGALRDTSAQVSRTAVESAIDETSRQLRGVVAGPTEIPILQVGNAISDAFVETNGILSQILGIDQEQLGVLRSILVNLGGGGGSPAVASQLTTTSPTIA